jgi:agmatine deiminase
LWLDHGELIGDDTDAHVDTLVRFVSEDTLVYVSCKDQEDEHYEELKKMEKELEQFRTLNDNPYQLIPLPLPSAKYKNNQRLPATYANFLITNRTILLPTYQDDLDREIILLFKGLFPSHEIIPINALRLIEEGGSIHCSTMHLPSIQKKFN